MMGMVMVKTKLEDQVLQLGKEGREKQKQGDEGKGIR
jgi:hypothetical protein